MEAVLEAKSLSKVYRMGDTEVRALAAYRQTEQVTCLALGIRDAQRHKGGITFDVFGQ